MTSAPSQAPEGEGSPGKRTTSALGQGSIWRGVGAAAPARERRCLSPDPRGGAVVLPGSKDSVLEDGVAGARRPPDPGPSGMGRRRPRRDGWRPGRPARPSIGPDGRAGRRDRPPGPDSRAPGGLCNGSLSSSRSD
ncbi:hypothetical protein THAOC_20029, partial [Thalassiosira oceanica]